MNINANVNKIFETMSGSLPLAIRGTGWWVSERETPVCKLLPLPMGMKIGLKGLLSEN